MYDAQSVMSSLSTFSELVMSLMERTLALVSPCRSSDSSYWAVSPSILRYMVSLGGVLKSVEEPWFTVIIS